MAAAAAAAATLPTLLSEIVTGLRWEISSPRLFALARSAHRRSVQTMLTRSKKEKKSGSIQATTKIE